MSKAMDPSLRIPVPYELFSPAETARFEGHADLGVLSAGPDEYRFDEPLTYRIDLTNTGDAILVAGTVEGVAKTACARCLEEVEVPLKGSVEGYFLLAPDASSQEGMEGDEFDVLPADKVIDLEPLIVAALLVEVPLVPLCDEDCKGICPVCGANRNVEECLCDAGKADDAPYIMANGKPNPFAVLKDVDFGK